MISRPLLRRGDRVTVRRDLECDVEYIMLHERSSTNVAVRDMRRVGGRTAYVDAVWHQYNIRARGFTGACCSLNWTDEVFVETARLIPFIVYLGMSRPVR